MQVFEHNMSHVVGLPPQGGNPTTCDSCSAIDSKEAFADSFQKLYERSQPCVVKDDDYFESQ
jgi:hypothetical protein